MKDDDLLSSYDNLVKSKGILDLIMELPSFEAELGEGCCLVFGDITIKPQEHRREVLHEIQSSSTSARRCCLLLSVMHYIGQVQ